MSPSRRPADCATAHLVIPTFKPSNCFTGRDVSGGSFNILEVQDAFYDAARALESLARKHTGKPTELKTNYLSVSLVGD